MKTGINLCFRQEKSGKFTKYLCIRTNQYAVMLYQNGYISRIVHYFKPLKRKMQPPRLKISFPIEILAKSNNKQTELKLNFQKIS